MVKFSHTDQAKFDPFIDKLGMLRCFNQCIELPN